MAKIQLTTISKMANVVVLEMTPSTILRIGRVHSILESVKEMYPQGPNDDDPSEDYCLGNISSCDRKELTSLIDELYKELMEM